MAKKSYCTQNNGDCVTCSLTNYGMDCANNPVKGMAPVPTMTRRGSKMDRALAVYGGFTGAATVSAILAQIPEGLQKQLTGKQLGQAMAAVNAAYHNGRKSTGADVIDGDYVWIDALNSGFDMDILRRLKKTETRTVKKVTFDGNLCNPCGRVYINDNYPGETRKPHHIVTLPKDNWQDWYYTDYETTTTWEITE